MTTAINHTVRLSCTGGASTVSGTIVETADAEANQIISVGSTGTDVEVSVAFPFAALKNFFALSTQDLTIETNAIDATGGNTIELVANVPFWYSASAGHTNPFSANVTKMYLTNDSDPAAAATVNIRILYDGTPA